MSRTLWHPLGNSTVRSSRRSTPSLEPLENRMLLATFTVVNSNDAGPGSLRFAIAQANLPANAGSTVNLSPPVSSPINLSSGELPIMASMTIQNLSGSGLEIRQTASNARVFHITGDRARDVNITGLTSATTLSIVGGDVTGENGGGFLVDNRLNNLTLTYVQVIDNSASDTSGTGGSGGGIYSLGTVELNESAVGTTAAPNTATQLGGGIYAGRGVTLNHSTVEGNTATVHGGGIVVEVGDAHLTDGSSVSHNTSSEVAGGIGVTLGSVYVEDGSHVDSNSARDVGGIIEGKGDVHVSGGSTVNGNMSTGGHPPTAGDLGGGGIAITKGDVYISASQVSNNQTVGMYSGGIVSDSILTIDRSTVADNTAGTDGGGLFNASTGNAKVRNSTFQSNQAVSGGGMFNFGKLTVMRSTIADNHASLRGGGICNAGQLHLIDVMFSGNTPNNVQNI